MPYENVSYMVSVLHCLFEVRSVIGGELLFSSEARCHFKKLHFWSLRSTWFIFLCLQSSKGVKKSLYDLLHTTFNATASP